MKSKSIGLKTLAVISILSTLIAGCGNVATTTAPTQPPPATAAPTIDVAPTLSQARTQAVQTYAANLTQNAPTAAPVQPTATSQPTATLPPTPTVTPLNPPTSAPTPTTVARLATLAPTPTLSTYNCVVFYTSPALKDLVKVDTNFTGSWRVENTGTENWSKTDFVIKYVYGTKFQTGSDVINLDRSVGPLGTYSVNIPMHSPDLAGPYYSRWEFQKGNLTVCVLNMTLHVVN